MIRVIKRQGKRVDWIYTRVTFVYLVRQCCIARMGEEAFLECGTAGPEMALVLGYRDLKPTYLCCVVLVRSSEVIWCECGCEQFTDR